MYTQAVSSSVFCYKKKSQTLLFYNFPPKKRTFFKNDIRNEKKYIQSESILVSRVFISIIILTVNEIIIKNASN